MDNENLKKEIFNNKLVLTYFEGSTCGACVVIKNKLNEISRRNKLLKFIVIDAIKNPKLAVEYEVFSVPLAILFVEGKESTRFGRNIDLLQFEMQIDRITKLMD